MTQPPWTYRLVAWFDAVDPALLRADADRLARRLGARLGRRARVDGGATRRSGGFLSVSTTSPLEAWREIWEGLSPALRAGLTSAGYQTAADGTWIPLKLGPVDDLAVFASDGPR